VDVPFVEPLATTETPPNGALLSASVTFPLTVRCATANPARKVSITVMLNSRANLGRFNFFFIIVLVFEIVEKLVLNYVNY
jgi:hypothetical protein